MLGRLSVVAALVLLPTLGVADPSRAASDAIVDKYVAVAHKQQAKMNGASMQVDIEAEVPKLQKRGKLHGLRKISMIGRITYDALRFEGDRSVKNEVIARYLSAESEVKDGQRGSLEVTPENYKFKYKGFSEFEGRLAHVFSVTPKKKRVGLFQGELWVDSETYLPLRESGKFVKSPSVFVKKVEFVKEYDIRGGVAVPRRMHSSVDTRLVGKALLDVAYSEVSLAEPQIVQALDESQN